MGKFGWSLRPGVSNRMIDEAYGVVVTIQPTLSQIAYAWYAGEAAFDDYLNNRPNSPERNTLEGEAWFGEYQKSSNCYSDWFKHPVVDQYTFADMAAFRNNRTVRITDANERLIKMAWLTTEHNQHVDFIKVTVNLDPNDPTCAMALKLAAERRVYMIKSQELGNEYYMTVMDRCEVLDAMLKAWVRGEDMVMARLAA